MGDGVLGEEEERMSNMILDYTTISDFLVCRRKFYWRHVRNLVPKVKSTALMFGGAWHKAMEAYWTEGDAIKVFTEEYGEVDVPLGDKRSLERGLKILADYMKRYPVDSFEILASEGSHGVEFERIIPDPQLPEEISVWYYGKMDKVIRWNGGVYVMEHKTTSQLGYGFFSQFALNHQVDGYIYLCKDKYGECNGVLVDAVLIAKVKMNCMRDVATRTEEDGKEFEVELDCIVQNIRWAIEHESYPMNKSLCQYYGECAYRDLCLYHGDERVIEGRYRESVWDAKEGKEVGG